MNIQKYTEKAQEAVIGAQSMADREGHPEITPEHLLLALVQQEGGIVPEILRKMNVDPAVIASAVLGELGKNPRAHGGSQPTLSARLRQVTSAAEAEAERLKDEYVSTEHLLLALASESGRSVPSARIWTGAQSQARCPEVSVPEAARSRGQPPHAPNAGAAPCRRPFAEMDR